MFRGREENGFQLILVNASFKEKDIIQSSLLIDHPAGATFHMGSVITTSPGALSLLMPFQTLILVTHSSRQCMGVYIPN